MRCDYCFEEITNDKYFYYQEFVYHKGKCEKMAFTPLKTIKYYGRQFNGEKTKNRTTKN